MACDLPTAFRLLNLPKRPRSPVEADALVRKGLPFHSLESLTAGSGLSADEVETILAIPPRTLARRKATRRFSLDESERLLRLALVVSYAAEVLGDRDAVAAWLTTRNRALGGEKPSGLLRTEVGTEAVLDTLGRIDYGVVS